MIDARMLRDFGLAMVLAVPTLSLTRPVAAEPLRPSASGSPVTTNAAIATMTTDERRTSIPSH